MGKRWCVLLGIMVGLLVAPAAQAQTNIKEVATALKHSHVYVAANAEGITQNTTSELEAQLNSSDNIVLAMLPASSGSNPEVVAQEIDGATGHKYIVGLALGSELTAASTIMSDDAARNLMERAVNTGTNPPERLGTFARNVHEWQLEHPNEPAAKKPDKGGGVSFLPILVALIAVACATIAILMSRRRSSDDKQEIKLVASPGNVREVLREIEHLTSQINDPSMRENIWQAIRDTDEYFGRDNDSQSLKSDSMIFVTHLKSVRNVLDRYVDIQKNPRYYDNPQELMRNGSRAISGFGEFVLRSIRAGRRSDLTQFNVDTDILDAQRYS